MKKLVLILVMLLASAQVLRAQDLSVPQRIIDLSAAYQPFTLNSAAATKFFLSTGMDAHAVTYTAPGAVTGVTVTVSGSTDGGSTWSTVGSSTSSTATISFTGTYTVVRVVATGMTAAMPELAGVYNSMLMAGHTVMVAGLSSGTAVPLAVNSSGNILTVPAAASTTESVTIVYGGLTTDYAGTGSTVTTLAVSSGTTVMTTATVDVQGIRCNNFSASTRYITLTDTAGNLFHGEATATLAFAIPAYADDQVIAANSHVRMVGIKMYASAGSAVNCTIWGKQ